MLRTFKLFALGFVVISWLGVFSAGIASAQDKLFPGCSGAQAESAVCKDKDPGQTQERNSLFGPDGILTRVINILALIIGIAAVIVIVIAGIQYMVSTGDPTKVNNAKNAILYAAIGLAVAVFARLIVVFVIDKL